MKAKITSLLIVVLAVTNFAWAEEQQRTNIFQKKVNGTKPVDQTQAEETKPNVFTKPAKAALKTPAKPAEKEAKPAKPKEPAKPKIVRAVLMRPSELKIPTEYGSIKEYWPHESYPEAQLPRSPEKLIIHIQDAHCNYEAQMNLAKMLEYLWLAHGVSLILVEGGSRSDSLSYMREYAPREKRIEVADKYLKSGKICGENYLDIVEEYPIDVFGIEKPELYDANMAGFLKLDEIRDKDLLLIGNLKQTAEALKQKLYSPQTLDLEAKKKDYSAEKMKFKDYAIYLIAHLDAKEKARVKKEGLPNMMLYAEALELEKKTDLKQTELERGKLLEYLTRTLPQAKLKECLSKTQDAKDNKIKQSVYYNYLKSLVPQPDKAAKLYPNLYGYIDYLTVFDSIDNDELFKELPVLEDNVYNKLIGKNKDARELYFISNGIETFEGLVEIKITPDEAKFYTQNKDRFKIKKWKEFLLKQARHFGIPTNIDPVSGVLDNHFAFIDNFYAVARQREDAFLENSIRAMDNRLPVSPLTNKATAPDAKPGAPKVAVLICGGYHTNTLMELFKKNNIAYIVVAPNVTTPTDKNLYRTVLKEVYTPMSRPENIDAPQPILPGMLRQKNNKENE